MRGRTAGRDPRRHEADQEHLAPAEAVAERSADHQQRAECEQVAVQHPLETREIGVESRPMVGGGGDDAPVEARPPIRAPRPDDPTASGGAHAGVPVPAPLRLRAGGSARFWPFSRDRRISSVNLGTSRLVGLTECRCANLPQSSGTARRGADACTAVRPRCCWMHRLGFGLGGRCSATGAGDGRVSGDRVSGGRVSGAGASGDNSRPVRAPVVPARRVVRATGCGTGTRRSRGGARRLRRMRASANQASVSVWIDGLGEVLLAPDLALAPPSNRSCSPR